MVTLSFVGTDGIMMKSASMDAIKNYSHLNGKCTVLLPSSYESIAKFNDTAASGDVRSINNAVELPKVQCILAT